MGDTRISDQIIDIVNQHRAENRVEFNRLGDALIELSRATTTLATMTSRMEERHSRHDDALATVSKQVEDHEVRVRSLEHRVSLSIATATASWKAISVAASVGGFVMYIVVGFISR